MTTVLPPVQFNQQDSICSEVSGSRFPVGSSARIINGSFSRARAITTRCCSPPDKLMGHFVHERSMPTILSCYYSFGNGFFLLPTGGPQHKFQVRLNIPVGKQTEILKNNPQLCGEALEYPSNGYYAVNSRPRYLTRH
jgi:hypothetical protein